MRGMQGTIIFAVLSFVLAACGEPAHHRPVTEPTATTTGTSGIGPSVAGPSVTVAPRPACAGADGDYHRVRVGSGETAVLLLGNGARGVVVGAQANGGLCQTAPFARALATAGYHVAVFDWATPYGEAMTAAMRALVAAGARNVVLGGFSRGALVALGVAASGGPRVKGVFSVSGGPSQSEGYPTIEVLATFAGPVLLVSSEGDPVFPAGTTASIAAAHDGPETVLILPGSGHALALLDGATGDRVRRAVAAFLTSVLGPA
jgi:pimeloyl-ACP methyl ester carboxylesterase